MISSDFVVVVKNSSAEDTITVAKSSGWNIAELNASHYQILPGEERRFYRKNGKVFRVTVKLPDQTKIKLNKVQNPCRVEVTRDDGKWISKRIPLEIESSEHQQLLMEERTLNLFKQNGDFYKILGVPKYAATEQVTEAFHLLMQPYRTPDNGEGIIQYCDGAGAYVALLTLVHDTLIDPEKKSEYDKRLHSPKKWYQKVYQSLVKYWNNFKALPWYWKLLIPTVTLAGIGGTIASVVTCGSALPIVFSVIAGCGLGGGVSSLLFAISNGAAEIKADKRNKGILIRLGLGCLFGATGGFLTAYFGPAITAVSEYFVNHVGALAITGAISSWIDSVLLSLANFIAQATDNIKNLNRKKFLLEIVLYPVIGALFGAAVGAGRPCIDVAFDEPIGAFIAGNDIRHSLKVFLKLLGKVPGFVFGQFKNLSHFCKLLLNKIFGNE